MQEIKMSVRSHMFLFCVLMFTKSANAEVISIAVASNFIKPMQHLAGVFEASTGHKLLLSYGSSGKLYAQIKHGAPYHIFFSADQGKIDALARDGLLIDASRFTYAVGVLVLWSAGSVENGGVFEQLKSGNFTKVALANPKLAPYGAAAVQVLESLNLQEVTAPKWVLGENIAQTYQFVYTQNADVGFVALSQLSRAEVDNKSTAWIVPEVYYSPIKQDAALLLHGKNVKAAHEFLSFIRQVNTQEVIASFGYKVHTNIEP